jgi:hypothetical protein
VVWRGAMLLLLLVLLAEEDEGRLWLLKQIES